MGRVLSTDGTPIPHALLDVWETNENGLYEQQDPEQPNMNLRGKFRTDSEGRYCFVGIKPVSYSIPDDGPVGQLLRALGRPVPTGSHPPARFGGRFCAGHDAPVCQRGQVPRFGCRLWHQGFTGRRFCPPRLDRGSSSLPCHHAFLHCRIYFCPKTSLMIKGGERQQDKGRAFALLCFSSLFLYWPEIAPSEAKFPLAA